MITISQQEHRDMVASAEATLIAKALSVECALKKGSDIDNHSQPLAIALANLVALEHYDTGKYEPAEYFNIASPDDVSGMFSNVNTINK